MAVKRTLTLKVQPSQHFPQDRLAIHPNDGFDLGLYTKSHPIAWSTEVSTKDFIAGQSGTILQAELDLLNECPLETLQMNAKQWERLGCPEQAICLLDGNRFLINGLPSEKKH